MPARDPGSSPRRPRSGSSSPLSSPTGPWSSFAARMLSSSPHPINIEPSSSVIINSEHAAASPPNHGDVSTSYKRVLSLLVSLFHLIGPVSLTIFLRRNLGACPGPISSHAWLHSPIRETVSGIQQLCSRLFQQQHLLLVHIVCPTIISPIYPSYTNNQKHQSLYTRTQKYQKQ